MNGYAKQKIPSCEINFHPHSFGDHEIRLFRWNGELYRGISAEKVPFFTRLFQDGIIQNLTEQGLLIDSEFTSLTMDGYERVMRHRTIPFVSYPIEWCAAMLKDAALTLINLAIELAQHGFTLGDAHPWNLLFDLEKGKFIFVDLGSIMPIHSSTWSVYDEFCRFCLYPLMLMSCGHDQIARLLMWEDRGVLQGDLLRLAQDSASTRSRSPSLRRNLELFFYRQVQRLLPSYCQQIKNLNVITPLFAKQIRNLTSPLEYVRNVRQKAHLNFLENVKREVESVILPSFKAKRFDDYERLSLAFLPQDTWSAKQKVVHKFLTELHPLSVLTIGSNTEWYSKLAAVLGSQVISFDTGQLPIAQLYYDACANKLPILPLIMDFTKPTPARGLADHWSIAATDRFRCDMVVALGLVHKIVLERRLNFNQITEGLALFSKQWLVVEFTPLQDSDVCGKRWSASIPWYTLDNFMSSLQKRFRTVSCISSYPEQRVLLLCEK